MGHKSLAVLTGDRFSDDGFFFFFTRNCMAVLQGGKKSGRNNEVTVLPRYLMAGFNVTLFFYFFQ